MFLDVYDIKLTDTELVMPADQGGEKWSTKDTKCDGKDTELKVRVWDDFTQPDEFHDVVTDFNNIRITNDGMVFVIAFVPKGTDIPLPRLGCAAADSGCCRRRRRDRHDHDGRRRDRARRRTDSSGRDRPPRHRRPTTTGG